MALGLVFLSICFLLISYQLIDLVHHSLFADALGNQAIDTNQIDIFLLLFLHFFIIIISYNIRYYYQ